jgi:hypothetical protein
LEPTKIASIASFGLGAASGGGAVDFFGQAGQAYKAYEARIKSAQVQHDPLLSREAQTYYDETLVPTRTGLYVTAGASAALIGTGVVLLFVDEGPVVMPIPGGGVLSWSGRF